MTDKKSNENAENENLAGKVKGSARQIWLAGLGAYNKAEEDAGRFFEKLVKEGEEIESRTRGVLEKQIKAVEDTVDGVRDRANDTLDKLESVFDRRVGRAMKRIGIPSWYHFNELEERLELLEKEIAQLKKQQAGK